MPVSKLVLHIPHSSTLIPDEVRRTFLIDDAHLSRELLRWTDAFTDQLFSEKTTAFTKPVIYPVSRMVVDPERFPDDSQEAMACHGLGAIYTATLDGDVLRNQPAPGEKEQLLNTYYHPHHQRLTDAVNSQLEQHGKCLIIDCHSFPARLFPFEENREKERPEICIGTDEYHTPRWLSDVTAGLFRQAGYTVGFNHPFSGTLVPLACYHSNHQVFSLMIEINRKCYMDEQTGSKNDGFAILRRQLCKILKKIKALV